MHTFGPVQSQITNDRETFERRNILNLLKYFLLNFLRTWIPCCKGCPVCNGTAPRSKCKMGLLYLLLLEVLGGRKVNRNLKPGRCQSTRGFHPGHCSLPHLHHLHHLHHHHLLYHLFHLLTWCKITTGRDAQCWTINGTNTITIIRIETCSISKTPPHTIDSVIDISLLTLHWNWWEYSRLMRRREPCKSGVGLWQPLSRNRMLAWRHPRVAWWQAGQVAEGHPWWQRWWHIRWKPLQRCWKFGFMMIFLFHSDLEGILQIIYLPLIGCPDDSLFRTGWLWCGKSGSDRSSDFGETCFYNNNYC